MPKFMSSARVMTIWFTEFHLLSQVLIYIIIISKEAPFKCLSGVARTMLLMMRPYLFKIFKLHYLKVIWRIYGATKPEKNKNKELMHSKELSKIS